MGGVGGSKEEKRTVMGKFIGGFGTRKETNGIEDFELRFKSRDLGTELFIRAFQI
jgi:hypothetical protein